MGTAYSRDHAHARERVRARCHSHYGDVGSTIFSMGMLAADLYFDAPPPDVPPEAPPYPTFHRTTAREPPVHQRAPPAATAQHNAAGDGDGDGDTNTRTLRAQLERQSRRDESMVDENGTANGNDAWTCAICQDRKRNTVLDCGHTSCGTCLLTIWRVNVNHTLPCPMCKRTSLRASPFYTT
jgi:hypothetical protein